jgi:hypothetical protein
VGQVFKFVWRLCWKINVVCMSLSPFDYFQSRFVTYLLICPRRKRCTPCRSPCTTTQGTTFAILSLLGAFAELRKAAISFVMSVRLYVRLHGTAEKIPIGRIFMKFHMWVFFLKNVEMVQVSLKSDKNNRYFTSRLIYIFLSFLLWMWNISDKICTQNQNTHFVFSNLFFSSENRVDYEILWKILWSSAGYRWQYSACA